MQSLVRVTFFAAILTPPVMFMFWTVAPAVLTVISPDDVSEEHAADVPTFPEVGSGYPQAASAGKQPVCVTACAVTVALCAELACADPPALLAVTSTRIVWLTS